MSDLIAGPRGSGRTAALLQAAAEGFAYPVVSTPREAVEAVRLARKLGLDVPHPLTYSSLVRGDFRAGGMQGMVLDNVDVFLATLTRGTPVLAVTWQLGPDGPHQALRSASGLLTLRGPRA